MPWVLAQESNFNKYKILKFIKISDGIKFLNQMFIFQDFLFFQFQKFQSWSMLTSCAIISRILACAHCKSSLNKLSELTHDKRKEVPISPN